MNRWIVPLLLAAVASASLSVHAQTLLAGDPEDSAGDDSGLFFDLNASNDVTIVSFDLYSDSATGAPLSMTIYSRPGSWVGFDASALGWVEIGTYNRNNNDNGDPDTFVLDSPLVIPAGQTAGIYVFSALGGIQHTDDCSPPLTYSDANLSLMTGEGNDDGGAFAGVDDNCMSFAGSVTYAAAPSAPPTSDTPIPTMSIYGLVLTSLGLLLVAIRRLRTSERRG